MIEVNLSDEEMHWCREKAQAFKRPGEHIASIEGSDTILIGYMGEKAFLSAFPGSTHADSRTFDIEYKGKPIEIKCRSFRFKPFPETQFMIRERALNRTRGIIVPCFANSIEKRVWIAGYVLPGEVRSLSTLIQPGEPVGKGAYRLHGDDPAYLMQVQDLRQFKRRF